MSDLSIFPGGIVDEEKEEKKTGIGLQTATVGAGAASFSGGVVEEPVPPGSVRWSPTTPDEYVRRYTPPIVPLEQTAEVMAARAKDPDRLRAIAQATDAFAIGLGVPMGPAFDAAQRYYDMPAEEKKKSFAQAVTDEWKRTTLYTKRGNIGAQWMESKDETEKASLREYAKYLETSMPPDDKQERNFLERLGLGGVYLAAQQVSTLAGQAIAPGKNPNLIQEIAKTATDFLRNGLTFRWKKQAELLARVGTQATGMGRMEGGNAALDMVEAGVDEAVAKGYGQTIGAINGAIEVLSDVMLATLIAKPAGALVKKLTSQSVRQVLDTLAKRLALDGAGAQLALGVVGKVAAGTITNTIEEVEQETVTFLATKAAAIHQVQEVLGGGTRLPDSLTDEEWAQLGKIDELDQSLVKRYEQLFRDWPQFLAMGLMPGLGEVVHGLRAVEATGEKAVTTAAEQTVGTKARVETGISPYSAQVIRSNIDKTAAMIDEIAATEMTPEVRAPLIETLQKHSVTIDEAIQRQIAGIEDTAPLTEESGREVKALLDMKMEVRQEAARIAPEEAAPAATPGSVEAMILERVPQVGQRGAVALDLLTTFRARREGKSAEQFVQDSFVPGVFSTPEESARVIGEARARGVMANAGVDFLADQRAVIHAVEQTDFKALTHEWAHVFGKHLTAEERAQVDTTFGTGVEGEERWAEAMVKFWQTGETEHVELRGLFQELGDLLRGARVRYDDIIPEETKRVMDDVLGAPAETGAAAGEAGTLFNVAEENQNPERIYDDAVSQESEDVVVDSLDQDKNVVVDDEAIEQATEQSIVEQAAETTQLSESQKEVSRLLRENQLVMNITVGELREQLAQAKRAQTEWWKTAGALFKERNAARAMADLLKVNAYVAKRIRQALKPPGQTVLWTHAKEMNALQAPLRGRADDPTLKDVQKRIKQWQKKNPGAMLPKSYQEIMGRRDINELTMADVEALADKIAALRKEGTALRKAQLAEVRVRRTDMMYDYLKSATGWSLAKIKELDQTKAWDQIVKRIQERGTKKGDQQLKEWARKNKIKMAHLTPQRIFEFMDRQGGTGAEAGAFKRMLWNAILEADDKQVQLRMVRDEIIHKALEENGLKAEDLVGWMDLPGGDRIEKDHVLAMYAYSQDENSRRALLYGNDWLTEDRINEVIDLLSDKEKAFVDRVIDMFSELFPEIEKVRLEIDNKTTEKVTRYFGMKREDDTGSSYDQELSTENAMRKGLGPARTQKGFMEKRKKQGTHQKPIRLDFFNTLTELLEKQTTYIAKEQWVRDQSYIWNGRGRLAEAVREAVQQTYGKPALNVIQQYVRLQARPVLWDAMEMQHEVNRFVKFLYRTLGSAQIAYKLSTVLVQTEGPFRGLSRMDMKHVISGMLQAATKPNATLDFVFERSPKMRNMVDRKAIDPFMQTLRELASSPNSAWRAYGKFINVGFAGVRAMNAWTVAAEWKGRYDDVMGAMEAEYKAGGPVPDEARAIAEADDAVYRTQPSGDITKRAPIYWTSSPWVQFLLRFSDANNKMLNMVAFDMPQAVKEHHIGRAVGVLAAYLLSSAIVGAVRRKRLPKDGWELMEDAALGWFDLIPYGLGAVPERGLARLAKAKGWPLTRAKSYGYQGVNLFEPVAAAMDMSVDAMLGKLTQEEIVKLALTIGEYSGLPAPAIERYVAIGGALAEGDIDLAARQAVGYVSPQEQQYTILGREKR